MRSLIGLAAESEMSEVPSSARRLSDRLRIQLLMIFLAQALFGCLALPWLEGMAAVSNYLASFPHAYNTALIFGIAAMAAVWALRQIADYPGTRIASYYLPTLLLTYSLAALVAFAFRFEYIRPIVLYSFLGSAIWLYMNYFARLRGRRLQISLVPGGDLRDIASFRMIDTRAMNRPSDHSAMASMVVADLHHDHPDVWERYLARCVVAGIPVHDVKGVVENLSGKVEFEHLSENSFGSVLPSSVYLKLKYLVDLVLSILLLPIVSIVVGIAAIAVLLESGRPIIFSQRRMGFRGKTFTMYKLRSMYQEADSGQKFTSNLDQRVTSVGKVLRKYRIDELPQLLNIIKGDMSWIGPRPEAIELSHWYDGEIPFYLYRHAVRPGITGWAQVNQGNVAEIEAATEKLRYDFYYIKNFSPWLDIVIALKTFWTVLGGVGSK